MSVTYSIKCPYILFLIELSADSTIDLSPQALRNYDATAYVEEVG